MTKKEWQDLHDFSDADLTMILGLMALFYAKNIPKVGPQSIRWLEVDK